VIRKILLTLAAVGALALGGCASSGRSASDWLVPGASTYHHYQDIQEETAAGQAALMVRPSEFGGRVDIGIDPINFWQAMKADPGGFAISLTKDAVKTFVWAYVGNRAWDEWGTSDSSNPPAVDLNGNNLRLNVFQDGEIPDGGFRLTGEDIEVNLGEARPEPRPEPVEIP